MPRVKIKCGDLTLSSLLQGSKWIALTAAFFLLFANFDNVPDCPELLRLHSGPVASASLTHHTLTTRFDTVYPTWQSLQPPAIQTQSVSDVPLAVLPLRLTQSFYQAADPSPPLMKT